MTSVFHTAVNAGFIRWMHEKNPEANVYFFSESSHAETCKELLAYQEVKFNIFPFFPQASKFTLLIRDWLGGLYAAYLFFISKKNDILFITNLLPISHWCIFILNVFYRRKLYIALHGQLEALLPDTPLGLTKTYFRLHGPLLKWDIRSQYVVLGKPVYENTKELFSTDTQVIVIDHPYESGKKMPPPPLKFPLRFGQIGSGNRGKGTEKLFRLGELLYKEIEDGLLELHLVGRLDPELRHLVNPWVKWYEKPLSESYYCMEISKLHHALFLRDAKTGRAVPSGSFFDAIKYGKSFLSLKHPYIEYYIDNLSSCGTICTSVEEMADEIRKLLIIC